MPNENPDLPDPPIPSDVDCVGLPYMPLKVTSLIGSELVDLSTGAEFKAAVLLWCKSWTEVPAGSLPNNDRRLARDAGVSLEEFSNIRDMALHGFILCSDDRFYHPVICDLAVAAFKRRRQQGENSAKRWAKQNGPKIPQPEKTDATDKSAQSHGMPKPMQGKVREGKVRESPLPPIDHPMGSKRPKPSDLIFVSEINGQKFDVPLEAMLEDLIAGAARNGISEEQRKKEAWFISVGVLRCLGLDEKTARTLIGEMTKKHEFLAEEVEKAALAVWTAKPNSAKPYFVSVCERIAVERRN